MSATPPLPSGPLHGARARAGAAGAARPGWAACCGAASSDCRCRAPGPAAAAAGAPPAGRRACTRRAVLLLQPRGRLRHGHDKDTAAGGHRFGAHACAAEGYDRS
jgi:hypothetical protein